MAFAIATSNKINPPSGILSNFFWQGQLDCCHDHGHSAFGMRSRWARYHRRFLAQYANFNREGWFKPLSPRAAESQPAPVPSVLLDRRYVYPRSALEQPIEDSFVAPEHGNITFRLLVYRDCAGIGFYENVGLEVEKPDGQRETYRQGDGGEGVTPAIYECQGPPEPRPTRDTTVPSLEGEWPFRGTGECTCSLHILVLAEPTPISG
jgi:hypothetical protein